MVQIVKAKKKGRPSKADLARRAAEAAESEVRRKLRRRNVKYTFDLDDYEDEFEAEEEEEERRRREKKLKVLMVSERRTESTPRRVADHALSDSDEDTKPAKKKKRKIDTVDDDDVEDVIEEDTVGIRERKAGSRDADSVPGTPSDTHLVVSLPDKKTLELILDKLQKKDTYGVFAEPVDPEELPDYHDVIEHPMDFATVRKKLGKGSYSTLEHFESDVLLICSNAMQYNAPDTIYYKQAFAIQELAKRKFQILRFGSEQYEKEELQSEQKTKSNSVGNKQIEKAMTGIAQETVAPDLTSGATCATLGDLQSGSPAKASSIERQNNVDEPVDGITTPSDNNLDKPEDLPSGRGLLSRIGRKPLIHDDHRRATYNTSTQPVSRPESTFTTFDGEIKQLVAVGLHADHTYARSLARFAAMLGPVAWNIASKRIEQALPPGFKFGRGWVGDYEPVSTPVLAMGKCSPKDTVFSKEMHNLPSTYDASKDEKLSKTTDSMHKNHVVIHTSEEKSTLFGAAEHKVVSSSTSCPRPSKPQALREETLETKPVVTASVTHQKQAPRAKTQPQKKIKKQVELNSPPSSANHSPRDMSERQFPNGFNIPASKSTMEPFMRKSSPLMSVPPKQPENGFREVPSGKLSNNNFDINRTISPFTVNSHNQSGKPANYFPHGQEQGLTDPVQLMRKLSENAQSQQRSLSHAMAENPVAPSSEKEDLSNASSTAARAWMSIGAGAPKSVSENTSTNRNQIFVNSLHVPTQVSRFRNDIPVSGMQFHQMNNNFPIQAFMSPHFQMGNEAHFQNRPPVALPQFVTADLSRFQMQSPRQSPYLQRHTSQKQETTVPPDLNLVFQSSGSPGKQSSGVQVDSQQPDLALQL